ncbi:hypothetical protein PENANT_c010G04938 [Penicillium antarcticum]|uniref:G domain-containing protein n=1 Tax=Penicillium antarcticum TaxID=416450 RepID=A0A1V6Q8V4_9EURO|nr:hypothetical protein PENANT_c010G04938 [Penicillium antarcticum]
MCNRKNRNNDAFIAVMGVTGFIVSVYKYEAMTDQTGYLIDTPGFDDGNKVAPKS